MTDALFGINKHNKIGTMPAIPEVDIARRRQVIWLGQGQFTVAYKALSSDRVFLFTDPRDQSKRLLATARGYLEHTNLHLPEIILLGSTTIEDRFVEVYETRMYEPLKINKTNRDLLVRLTEAHEEADNRVTHNYHPVGWEQEFNQVIVNTFKAISVKDVYIRAALRALSQLAPVLGKHIIFDAFRNRRNVRSDSNGNIVFIDPMFDIEARDNARRYNE